MCVDARDRRHLVSNPSPKPNPSPNPNPNPSPRPIPNPNPSPNPSPNPNPNLNPYQLDISWCRGVSDDGAGLLADACSQLHTLTIWGCSQLTQRFLHGHSNQQLRIVGRGPTQ